MALDTYFRGNSQELDFCQKIRAGGNHLVVVTAAGHVVAEGHNLRLREKELAGALQDYHKLPQSARHGKLPDPSKAVPPKRPVPTPPPGGLIVKGYCTYMKKDASGKIVRSKEYYYKENPNRWAAETQSDMLWLTKDEWQSLIPTNAKAGNSLKVSAPIQNRFFGTIGIDYMEGSVNSLPVRNSTMTITVEKATPTKVEMRLDGYAELGKEFDLKLRGKEDTRGSQVRVLGYLTYNRSEKKMTRFDVVGVGRAWGMKRHDHRAIRIEDYPWMYAIACELVDGDSPIELVPPYNMLHYGGSVRPYFGTK